MPYLNFNSASPTLKLTITAMSMITIGIIIWYMGFLLSRIFFCLDVQSANEILYGQINNLSVGQLKYYQILYSIGFFVVPGIFLQWLFSTPEKNYFVLNKAPYMVSIIIVAIAIIFSIPFINYLIEYNKSVQFPDFLSSLESSLKELEVSAALKSQQLLAANNLWHFLLNILIVAIIPAIGEEFIFRGIIQKIFYNISHNIHMAVIFTAILFSIIHGQFYGFIPRFILGMFFGYLMVWSKTIWLPVLAHFINNTLAITALYFYSNFGFESNLLENAGSTVIVISCILFLGGSYIIRYYENRKANPV